LLLRKTGSRSDAVGVGAGRRGVRSQRLTLLLVGAAATLAPGLALRAETPGAESAHVEAPAEVAPSPSPAPNAVAAPRARAVRRSAVPRSPAAADEVRPKVAAPPPGSHEEPLAKPSGIGLYPPRGTDPPRRGILVPEGFVLPEGYVRHHQTTDDGKKLPAILIFHPDYEWLDGNGDAIVLPEDGIVPAELAPPGMPIEMLDLSAIPGESDSVA
jgi:hypothetical protein